MLRNLPVMRETQVLSLGWEDTLGKGMAILSSILAWSSLWTEEPVGYIWVCKESDTTQLSNYAHTYGLKNTREKFFSDQNEITISTGFTRTEGNNHRLQPARLLCPWDSPGTNTGVGCHFLLQGIFPTQEPLMSPALAGRVFTTSTTWKALYLI